MHIFSAGECLSKSLNYFGDDVLAADQWVRKYALKQKDKFVESNPDDMHRRLANAFHRMERKLSDNPISVQRFYESMKKFKRIVPQGSPMYGIDNPYSLASVSNCFIVKGPDDSIESIFNTARDMAQIMKRRGGVGVDISGLRPEGMRVNNSANTSSGAYSFSDFFSYCGKMIGQNGRGGAEMITMDIRHPDSEKFATMKSDLTKVTGANVSLKITDNFMQAVENDTDFQLRWPIEGEPKITKIVRARDLWEVIVECAQKTGEPGLLMWDNICNNLPAHYYPGFKAECVNPCLAGDTRLHTSNGLLKLKDLYDLQQKTLLVSCDTRVLHDKNVDISNVGTEFLESTGVHMTSPSEALYKIILSSGHEIKATSYHEFFTPRGIKKVNELGIGDQLLLQSGEGQWGDLDLQKEAALSGWIVGDGSYSSGKAYLHFYGDEGIEVAPILREYLVDIYRQYTRSRIEYPLNIRTVHMESCNAECEIVKRELCSQVLFKRLFELGLRSDDKLRIPDFIWSSNKETVSQFLKFYFDADGSVQINEKTKYISIRISSVSEKLLKGVQVLLSNFGIMSTIRVARNRGKQDWNYRGEIRTYNRKKSWELMIHGRANVVNFMNDIGFTISAKRDKAEKWLSEHAGSHNTHSVRKFIKEIVSIEELDQEPVYCLTQPINNSIIANGIITSQCAELVLSPYDSCRLISINLTGYVVNRWDKDNCYFDYDSFASDVELAMYMSDDLVELEIEAIGRIRQSIIDDREDGYSDELILWDKILNAAVQGRRTGLGTHGLGDCLAMLCIKYDSNIAIDTVDLVYGLLKDAAYRTSIKLAKERGAFPAWQPGMDWECEYIKRLPEDIQEDMKVHGRRNISLLTNAPTGTVSMMSQTSSGIEPIYRLEYDRRVKLTWDDVPLSVDFVDAIGDKWHKYSVKHPAFLDWMQYEGFAKLNGYKIPNYLITSNQIDTIMRVKIQGTIQKHIDHGVSSTLNLPAGSTVEDVKKIYLQAWKNGLKGVTVYVDGSRDGVLLSKGSGKSTEDGAIVRQNAIKRPHDLPCKIHRVQHHDFNWIVLVSFVGEEPYEVFAGLSDDLLLPQNIEDAKIRKLKPRTYAVVYPVVMTNGECSEAIIPIRESFTQDNGMQIRLLMNAALRHGMPIETIYQTVMKSSDLSDFSRVVARVLKKYVNIEKSGYKMKCNECGGSLAPYDGCFKCNECGASKCE